MDLTKNDDWQDEKNWVKACPSIDVLVQRDFLRAEMLTAKNDPTSLNNFLTKYMNLWVQQENRWMPMDKWNLCSGISTPVDPAQARVNLLANFYGRACIIGGDFSDKTDLSAVVCIFPPLPGQTDWVIYPEFFLPQNTMYTREKNDQVPYSSWQRGGFITTTPGDAIDHEFIRERIVALQKTFRVIEFAYDPAHATQLALQLQARGVTCAEVSVSYKRLSEAMNFVLTLVIKKQLVHLANPVMTWCASNVAVRMGAMGDIMPDKTKAAERIDGISALVTGMARAIAHAGDGTGTPKLFFV
jgi:phage terminase large subunit-like protein